MKNVNVILLTHFKKRKYEKSMMYAIKLFIITVTRRDENSIRVAAWENVFVIQGGFMIPTITNLLAASYKTTSTSSIISRFDE